MEKFWRVAIYEYRRHVLTKSFIFAILSVPLMLGLTIGMGAFAVNLEKDWRPVGYVDYSGLLADPLPAPRESDRDRQVELMPFGTREEAQRALESEEIQAYYVLEADYWETNEAELVFIDSPGENATQQFRDIMQVNLLAGQPAETAHRVAALSDDELVMRTPDGSREFGSEPLSRARRSGEKLCGDVRDVTTLAPRRLSCVGTQIRSAILGDVLGSCNTMRNVRKPA